MFEPEILQPSWSFSDNITSSLDEAGDFGFGLVAEMDSQEFSSIYTTPEGSNGVSFWNPYLPNLFPDEHTDMQVEIDETINFSAELEELGPIFADEIDDFPSFLEENEESFHFQQPSLDGEDERKLGQYMNSSNDTSMEMTMMQPSLILPTEGMEIDNQLSILHLVMAYGEAMSNQQMELAEVIVKRISSTVSPLGDTMERLLYYLFHNLDRQSDYLKAESKKNFYAAYKAFYQIFPNGKFAHFVANSAIMEAMPNDRESVHIFDFDMGDGLQWSSMIEALGHQPRELRLTSIKWGEEDSRYNPAEWKFEETKRRLLDHARAFNLNMRVDEMEVDDLIEMKRMKNRSNEREWCVFNCMSNLPHMGRVRSRKDVIKFTRMAKELVTFTSSYNTGEKDLVIFGDGGAWEKLKRCSSFTTFLDGNLMHYQALLESLECNFPINLVEARTAMECLFVAPFVSSSSSSSLGWIGKWEETMECCDLPSEGLGVEGWKVSEESVMEAKEMVREGESLYGVRIEGENNNELVLNWKGTQLVKVSCWQSN